MNLLWTLGCVWIFKLAFLFFFPNICPGVEFLDHMATLFLIFKGTPILFSIVAAPIYIPTNRAGFPDGSDGKESACNVRYPDLNSKSERSPGEGNGNPLQYSWLEDPMDRGAWWATVHGVAKSQTWLSNSHTHQQCKRVPFLHTLSSIFYL